MQPGGPAFPYFPGQTFRPKKQADVRTMPLRALSSAQLEGYIYRGSRPWFYSWAEDELKLRLGEAAFNVLDEHHKKKGDFIFAAITAEYQRQKESTKQETILRQREDDDATAKEQAELAKISAEKMITT